MSEQLKELLSFLILNTRLDLKSTALTFLLGLSASEDGRSLVKSNPAVIKLLQDMITDSQPVIAKDAMLVLLNLSASKDVAEIMIDLGIIPRLMSLVTNPDYLHSDAVCMTLSNLTQLEKGAGQLTEILMSSEQHSSTEQASTPQASSNTATTPAAPTLYQLVDIFDRKGYNKNANFHYLATVFVNITQISVARQLFLDKKKCILPRLIPYTQFYYSEIRRGGIVGLLRNLCFEVGYHEWLLSDEIDILPSLLLPLAGPEQFEGEEEKMEQLPEDLQYLPIHKSREPDPDIRKMLIETLMKLCSTKSGRLYLKSKQVYLIMRELHKSEEDPDVKQTCETLVSILISDEPEPGMENLHEVELPNDS